MTFARAVLLSSCLLLPVHGALAASDPVPGPRDTRMRTAKYDPQQVYRIVSTGLAPVQVILEAGEKPLTVVGASTDPKTADEWFARPSGNGFVLQPMKDGMKPSPLFMRTVTADGRERHYTLELRVRDGSVTDPADKQATMTVQFTYPPPPPTPEAIAATQERRRRVAALDADHAMKVRLSDTPRRINKDYWMRDPVGCPILAPSYTWDDGHRTTMVFAPNAVLPEIYTINQDNKPARVTAINETTATGLQVVIPTVQRFMELRRGGKVCAFWNKSFDPIGTQPGDGSGTISPDVRRVVREP